MKALFTLLKLFINSLLFVFYSFIFITAGNFLFWLVLSIMGKTIPASDDPIHVKIAVLIIFLSLLITLLFRKIFYISIFTNVSKKIVNEKNDENKEPIDEDLKIYVNKEIK